MWTGQCLPDAHPRVVLEHGRMINRFTCEYSSSFTSYHCLNSVYSIYPVTQTMAILSFEHTVAVKSTNLVRCLLLT